VEKYEWIVHIWHDVFLILYIFSVFLYICFSISISGLFNQEIKQIYKLIHILQVDEYRSQSSHMLRTLSALNVLYVLSII